MAQDTDAVDGVTDKAAGKAGISSRLMMVAAVLVALLVGGGGVAAFFMFSGGDDAQTTAEAAPAVKAKALYTKVRTLEGQPMFVVTLASEDGKRHMLQVHIEAKSRDPEVVEVLSLHMPRVVAKLNELFRSQPFESLLTVEGKLQLQAQGLQVVQEFMQEKIGRPGVETLLFTSFVMQ
jgi:flagellar FliL protein